MIVNLMLFLWFMSVVAILGVGYALGGGENQSTANYINSIIAFAGVMSAGGTICTLYFLIQVRNDWKKPKTSDSALDFKLSLKRWLRESSNLYDLMELQSKTVYSVPVSDFNLENESNSWTELVHFFDKYEFYHGQTDELQIKFNELKTLRNKFRERTAKFKDPLLYLRCYRSLSPSWVSIPKFKPLLHNIGKEIDRLIEMSN